MKLKLLSKSLKSNWLECDEFLALYIKWPAFEKEPTDLFCLNFFRILKTFSAMHVNKNIYVLMSQCLITDLVISQIFETANFWKMEKIGGRNTFHCEPEAS